MMDGGAKPGKRRVGTGFSNVRILLACGISLFAASGLDALATVKSKQSGKGKVEWRGSTEPVRMANASLPSGVKHYPELPVRKPAEIRPQPKEAATPASATAAETAPEPESKAQEAALPETSKAAASKPDIVLLPNATEPLIGPNDIITTQAEREKPQNTETEETAEKNAIDDNPMADTAEQRPQPQDRGEEYCANIANAAADARFAWQKQILEQTEQDLQKRVALLEEKIAVYKKWVERRDEFIKKADKSIIEIYAKMPPDAAAQQLTALDEETAAAVLVKLNPRVSSAVMAEMEANKAARLTSIISASTKGPKDKKPAPEERGS